MFRKLPWLGLIALLFVTTVAGAAPRDKSAQKKIEEAIYTNFLNTDFDAAEGLLLGTIRACEDKCSPALLAKAWMYVGVVRGTGRNDLAGATEAFKTALQTDPTVALDVQIANEPVKATFAKLKKNGGGAAAAAPPPAAASAAFTCTPSPTEIETRRPVPMQCETDADLGGARLHYRTFGDSSWQTIVMKQEAGAWRGTIPCSATQNTGKLKFYVDGTDADGKIAAALGSKDSPNTADVVSETSADPPAFPSEDPPARCEVGDVAAAGTPAATGGSCGTWGAPCGADNCCETGLSCNAGTCEGKCENDGDCKNGGTCNDGKCEGGETPSEKAADATAIPKNWVGLHFGFDIASISSSDACQQAARKNEHIACFNGGATYTNVPSDAAPGKISGGFTPSTMRLLASYERLFGPFGIEARLGFAFNGGQTPQGGTAFVPFHAEVRAKYWLLGEQAFAKKGFRPWVHIGGGLAEVDATVKTAIVDCGPAPGKAGCVNATGVSDGNGNTVGSVLHVDATKQLGLNFITFGGGVMYAVAKNHGAVFNLNMMIPFPSSGFVIEPSIGYEFGF